MIFRCNPFLLLLVIYGLKSDKDALLYVTYRLYTPLNTQKSGAKLLKFSDICKKNLHFASERGRKTVTKKAQPFGCASLLSFNREIEICIRIGFVGQREMPPLTV
jgi:hypothetical protein